MSIVILFVNVKLWKILCLLCIFNQPNLCSVMWTIGNLKKKIVTYVDWYLIADG